MFVFRSRHLVEITVLIALGETQKRFLSLEVEGRKQITGVFGNQLCFIW